MRGKTSRLLLWAVMISVVLFQAAKLYAAEHPGKTQEQVGTTTKEHAGTTSTTERVGQSKEHAGATPTQEHAGKTQEHASTTVVPTDEQIRQAMQLFALQTTSQHGGYFPIKDERIGKERKLTFQRVHQRVGKLSSRDGYFSCADFVDQETGEKLDIDFWVTMKDGKLQVTGAEVHKVNDKPRFTYNEKDEKIRLN